MAEFFSMDGYAPYVWSAYGITLGVLLLNVYGARRAHRRSLEHARRAVVTKDGGRKPTVTRIE